MAKSNRELALYMEENLKNALKNMVSDGTLSKFLWNEMRTTIEQLLHSKEVHGEASGSMNAWIDK